MCVRFLFVQPEVVSTCNVTEPISFVNSFAAVFRKGVLGSFGFFVGAFFEARFQRYVELWLLAFWTEFGVPLSRELHACVFFHFDCILDFPQQRQTLKTSFGGALRFGGCAFPVHRTSQLTLNLKPTKTRLERICSNLTQLRQS